MSYRAKVINVMVACPSDIPSQELQVIKNVIWEWNYIHSQDKNIVLMPVGWDSHSSPAMGDRPQAIINRQVLKNCDLLLALFWTKLGTPTGKAASGTVEEIEEHVKAGKPAMIYFSTVPVRLDSVDPKQYQALQDFKASLQQRGLYAEYDSPEDFREKLSRHLGQTILRHFAAKKTIDVEGDEASIPRPNVPELSDRASILLIEGSQDPRGNIIKIRTMHGTTIQANDRNLIEDQSPRSVAKWEAALNELRNNELIEDRGRKGEVFVLTHEGYRVADLLKEKQLVLS